MTQSSPPELTPKLVKAARALLAWSQQDLAKAANVATSTVADFERGQRTPVANNAQAIRGALETANIHFLPTGAIVGPPVQTAVPSQRSGAPIRWVTARDLADWANRTDGVFSLPTLVAHLIRASHPYSVQLRFPGDEGVRYAGWDGVTITATASDYVPEGYAGWEIGAQEGQITQKAGEEYRKRTSKPGHLVPADSTFIFVTARHWPKKDEWALARQREGHWKAVKVYDADDLVHWIELVPPVGLWLARRLNKRPPGTREVEEIWEEWSLAAEWPLSEDLVLSDRDQDSVEVLRWLRGAPTVLSLQATTTDEIVAFFHATVRMLPEDIAAIYQARSLVATTASAARGIVNAREPMIVLMTDPEPGLAKSMVQRGHHVLLAYDALPVARGEVRVLARPSREGIAAALADVGIAEPTAKRLARDSARNLTVLRRLMPGAPGELPRWLSPTPSRALLAALLAGGWDEETLADRARLAEFADQSYEAIAGDLAPLIGEFDSPLQKIGSTWRVASPVDAWFLLAPSLSSVDIARFEAAAYSVLSSADPRFEMDPNERWMAPVRGVHPEYSGMLRHGVGQVLILLALWGDRVRGVSGAADGARAIVARVLKDADSQLWWSLTRDFRLLAEASPEAFLGAIEDSLDQEEPPIRVLFGTDDGGPFGTEHLSDLLWALEMLAWSPEYVTRVTHVLARLDALDNPPGRYMNRPANSLRQIHLFWLPQTYAPLDQRLRALDLIRKHESDAAWKLMLGLLPRGHDTSSHSPLPRWRDFTIDKLEPVTWALIGRGAAAVTDRLVSDVGTSAARWATLLERFVDLAPDTSKGLAALETAERNIQDRAARSAIWRSIRRVLHHHRQFPDADWSMAAEILGQLAALYDRFAPADPLERSAWLFDNGVGLPDPPSDGWESESRDVEAAQRHAAAKVFAEGGVADVLALARMVEIPGYIGRALYETGLSETALGALLEASLRSDDQRERDVGHGLINTAFRDLGDAWATALIQRAKRERWGDTAFLAILRALPLQKSAWTQAAKAGSKLEREYWLHAPVYWMSEDSDDVAFAINKLIAVGRAHDALPLANRGSRVSLPSPVLVELLEKTVEQQLENKGDPSHVAMFQHNVTEILEQLDARADVDRNTLIQLEWRLLPVLAHSRRPAKTLRKALSDSPALFIQMLSAIYRPSADSGVVDEEPADSELAVAIAHQAYQLLDLWDHLPGTGDDGTIDGSALERWIKEARTLARSANRLDVADNRIGQMLSASPIGSDGNWPAEAVREALDLFHTKSLIDGFQVGKQNRRGVTSRMPGDGGNLERAEAAKYRKWAKAIAVEHPRTARALEGIAEGYDAYARSTDQDSERMDWEA